MSAEGAKRKTLISQAKGRSYLSAYSRCYFVFFTGCFFATRFIIFEGMIFMKRRLLAFLVCIMACLSLCACGESSNNSGDTLTASVSKDGDNVSYSIGSYTKDDQKFYFADDVKVKGFDDTFGSSYVAELYVNLDDPDSHKANTVQIEVIDLDENGNQVKKIEDRYTVTELTVKDGSIDYIVSVNNYINDFAWVKLGLLMLLGAGILLTLATKVFQISHLPTWWKKTIGGVFKKDSKATKNADKKSISQFQALCTALAATIGTGNIAGVAAAIVIGGPGAVFWMWIAAFFGMMTNFSENVLGIFFRRRNKNGEWSGGPMYYLRDGLGSKKGCKHIGKILAVLFSIFAILASFGIGNMGQVNKITINIQSAFFGDNTLGTVAGIPTTSLLIGIALVIIGGLIIIGGLQRIASVAERVVPFMAILYVVGSLAIFFINIDQVGAIFSSIFKFAFGVEAAVGGVAGATIKTVITQGCKRGVFSNEAGLGSSVLVHSSSNVKEPVTQGMWGIFEVFFDTMIVCTMTAIVVLSSGYIDLETGLAISNEVNDATLVASAFGANFGKFGEMFIAVAMLLFAFTTVLGWSQYGSKAVEYLFGEKSVKFYRVFFVLMIISGAIMTSSLAWDISDTFNGLMMIPNLIGVVVLFPLVMKITKNYVNRRIKGKNEKPMLSSNPEIQAETEVAVAAGED